MTGAGRKYRNVPTTVDGVRFASAKEARRYGELRLLERVGQITGLQLQPRYPLTVNGQVVATYVGDFLYVDAKTGAEVTEDVKGLRLPLYKLKAKLFAALYGRLVVEV